VFTLKIDLLTLTDDKIQDLIHKFREAEKSINLGIPFTDKGLEFFWSNFRCTRCGKCCDGTITGPNGETFVLLFESDIKLLKRHINPKKKRRLLIEKDEGKFALRRPCHFYTAKPNPSCKIYNDRPYTCRNYPLETPRLDDPSRPPSLTVDPYCQGACNLFHDILIITKARAYKDDLAKGNKNQD